MDIEAFKKRLEQVQGIPTIPTVLAELMHCLSQEASDTEQIADLISQDAGLVARLLKLANSSAMARRVQITSIQRAVAALGRNQVRQICMGDGVWTTLKPLAAKSHFNLEGFELHSLLVAELSQELARRSGTVDAEDVYAAALLHDIGKFLLLAVDQQGYADAIRTAGETQSDLLELELEKVGWDHTMVGGWFAEYWGLPATVQAVARWHHNPEAVADQPHGPMVAIVCVANNLLKVVKVGDSGNPAVHPIGGLLGPLHLAPGDLQEMADRLKD
jgi:putative nucleotidyltransferase with HDIG domain